MIIRAICLMLVVVVTHADVYLHNLRGSNDRLNEKSANRKNANRVFDSQNNNRGGYNVGDKTDKPAGGNADNQYQMTYFQSGPFKTMKNGQGQTLLTLEWTNQHGCGGNENTDPHKLNCNIVLQYMCQPDTVTGDDMFRDGTNTGTQGYNKPQSMEESEADSKARKTNNVDDNRVIQEPWQWYDKCYMRERNKGLFTADQQLKTNNGRGFSSAIYTRQNPNGQRRGYECPEERDYYPYWHPVAWKDIIVLAENATMCGHYQQKSFNTKAYHECVEFYDKARTKRRPFSRWNNQKDCDTNGGAWTLFHNYLEKAPAFKTKAACEGTKKGLRYIWAMPYDAVNVKRQECLVALDRPDCHEAPWTRSNHLGNGRDGVPNNYTWILPHFPSGERKRCVLRIRYNISTDDYDPYHTDSRHNEDLDKDRRSPIEENPYVNIGLGASVLRLAINTAQTGRTFQDRSHVFYLAPRPGALRQVRLYNLNVRGKRGNIVQVYPAVEYDFIPNQLTMTETDAVMIQWTGSNTHNNGEPAGDGQAGDDGEGTGGTDRNNMVETMDLNDNYPTPYEHSTLWGNAEVLWSSHGQKMDKRDLAVHLASAGYYRCVKASTCQGQSVLKKTKMNNLLNNAPASFAGVIVRMKKGVYHYMCSRNNNFTNRSQKGTITIR